LTRIRIERSPETAASEVFDIVIIGGGIYGSMMLLRAAQLGFNAILLEQHDFGAGTSFNSLRIIHGGLRYLQSADFGRVIGMIQQRAWFLENFPDLVEILPCLMPVYNVGLRRKSTLRTAMAIDNRLNHNVNARLEPACRIPRGYIAGSDRTRELFPLVRREGLKAGAVWCDAQAPDSQRLIMEVLRWASAANARALNYVKVEELLTNRRAVSGVSATDTISGRELEFRARVVINAAGPACRGLARHFDKDFAELFRPSLAWNVILERPPLSDHALAVSRREAGSHTYFVVPWKGKIMLGTGHASCPDDDSLDVGERRLDEMMDDLNAAIPAAGLDRSQIAGVLAGLLPVRRVGTTALTSREVVIDHGRSGGPDGLISVSGVKMFASQQVASKVLRTVARRIFPDRTLRGEREVQRPSPGAGWDPPMDLGIGSGAFNKNREGLRKIIDEESVMHLDDLVLRRTTLWENRRIWMENPGSLLSLFTWDEETEMRESARLRESMSGSRAR
jgi:glycerol-3-phosphate dehydrogenase